MRWFLDLLASWFNRKEMSVHVGPPLGIRTLRVAQAQLGKGETEGNNRGAFIRKLTGGKDGMSWCAHFLSWCIAEAGGDIPHTGGAKRLYRSVGRRGAFLDEPEVGAIVCWQRGKAGSWKGHVGICCEVNRATGVFFCLEGNRGGFPSLVAKYKHATGEGGLIGFARLP